jgi:hypothetical protein
MPEILGPITFFVVMGLIGYILIVTTGNVRVVKLQVGVQTKLLDKLHTAENLIAYGETEAGRHFLASLIEERAARNSPHRSILSGVRAGILLVTFGGTLLLLHHVEVLRAGAFLAFGAISMALGVGFGLAAGATYGLSRKLGLLDNGRSL